MIKKSITYENLDGTTITEDFFFHISKAELIQLEMDKPGGMGAHLQRIIASENPQEIFREFREFMLMGYGTKEGGSFVKSPQARLAFSTSEPFGELMMELMQNPDEAAKFIQGLLPNGFNSAASNATTSDKVGLAGPAEPTDPAPVPEFAEDARPTQRVLTQEEVRSMDALELQRGIGTGEYVIG